MSELNEMFGAILSGNGFTATARRHHVAIKIMRKQTLLSPFFNLKSFWCPKKQLCSKARRGKPCKSQNTGLIFRQVVLEKRSGLSFSFILAFFLKLLLFCCAIDIFQLQRQICKQIFQKSSIPIQQVNGIFIVI